MNKIKKMASPIYMYISLKNLKTIKIALIFVIVIGTLYTFGHPQYAHAEILYFNIVKTEDAEKLFDEAQNLKKIGNIDQALLKYESAVISKRVLLAKDDFGLKKMLIDKYEKLIVSNPGIENYYKLGYLYDVTGSLEDSIKNYEKALKMSSTDDVARNISALLEDVKKDIAYYEKMYKKDAAALKIAEASEKKDALVKEEEEKPKEESTARKMLRSQLEDYKDRIEANRAKLSEAEKSLAGAGDEERKSKNDWSGRSDFKRDWRDTESSDPLVDKEDPYQNTYRRRYRQAKKSREAIETEIDGLKKENEKLEEDIRVLEAQLAQGEEPNSRAVEE